MEKVVVSVGGSLIVPRGIDTAYVKDFCSVVKGRTDRYRFVLVCGGGSTARQYIEAADLISEGDVSSDDLDWLGIESTRLNARLVRIVLRGLAHPKVLTDPFASLEDHAVVVAAGHRPGYSTDTIAVRIARNNNCQRVINLTNTDYVYDKDPKTHSDAQRIEKITWPKFRKDIVGDKWAAGWQGPFDPIASKEAEEAKLTVIVAGRDLQNLEAILDGRKYTGTTITP
jgi:uridylate kinase